MNKMEIYFSSLNMMKSVPNLGSLWDNKNNLLFTRLNGEVDITDVLNWEKSLLNTLETLLDNSIFKIYIDLLGFKAIDVDTHKRFREIIPLTLSRYGWRVGYLDLFDESKNLELSNNRGIRCVAAAHIHHDVSKINKYQFMFSTNSEGYFNGASEAFKWIFDLNINNNKTTHENRN
ncbi:hypothetical protein ACFSKN_09740 [Mariniflexile gromovii]|uniref:Uncharacterized protein n=1 Tax=Mariniflexile gromovii TaxID=362523 RepID=A0ABS4BYB4_9FLAO|nr:hypothetical protein [Mariniflexile gromovii]MBP0905050.1 hypothetical protein [Mariniflexile gromovii]